MITLFLAFLIGVLGGVLIVVIRRHNQLVGLVNEMKAMVEMEAGAIDNLYECMDDILEHIENTENPPKKTKSKQRK